jgi:hypothetical protein
MRLPIILIILSSFTEGCGQNELKRYELVSKNNSPRVDSLQVAEVMQNSTVGGYYPNWKWYHFKDYKLKAKFPVRPRIGVQQNMLGDSVHSFSLFFITEKDTTLPIYAYSIAVTKLPMYDIVQLDSLFSLVDRQIKSKFGKLSSVVRVFQSMKAPINEYEYFVDNNNKYGREAYIRVRYTYGILYWTSIVGKIGQDQIEAERDFLNSVDTPWE